MTKLQISKLDIHPLDKYIKIMANKFLMLLLFILIISMGLFISFFVGDSIYLIKSGSIGTMIGTLLTLSPMFANGVYLSRPEVFKLAETDNEGNIIRTTEEGRKVSVNIMYGVFLIITSTVISTFGDLIPL
ncbi:hypothetical protein [Proteus vulgaris]|uniref:hypothetical protein n=1 Tax=Proteus vulgaris TaxID=585 RepID=UPI0034D537E8